MNTGSKYLTILLAVAALLLSVGCSNEDISAIVARNRVSAQVTASINNGKSVTRASTDGETASFASGDMINVVAMESTTVDENTTTEYSTYQYTLSNNSWSAATPYYFTSASYVTFKGWYSTSTASDNSISIDTQTQTATNGWNSWDILVAPASSTSTVTANITSPTVSFTNTDGGTDNRFAHIMSKVTFNFYAGDGITDLSNLSGYTINDIITDATFNTQTCTLTVGTTKSNLSQSITGSAVQSITCDPIILVPQELSTLSLEVTFNDVTYLADLSLPGNATALEGGTHYTFNVTINNSDLDATASIVAWSNADTQEGIAKASIYTTGEDDERTYTVSSISDLEEWANYVNGVTDGIKHLGTNFTLAADITLVDEWTTVISGKGADGYQGTFDGGGYTITNLEMNYEKSEGSDDYQGFIGYLGEGGVVKNVILKDAKITSTQNAVGALVGYNNGGTITNCQVINGTVTCTKDRVGGLVGWNGGSGFIIGCSFSGTVTGSDENTGGVVGYNNKGNVVACYATGTVTGTTKVGGVVGYNYNYGTVTASYFSGTVRGTGSEYIGGAVGYNESGSTVNTNFWKNTTDADDTTTYTYPYYGIGAASGSTGSDDNATKVDDNSVCWSDSDSDDTNDALSAMNSTLGGWSGTDSNKSKVTCDWRYKVNDGYSSNDDTSAPLLLEKTAAE